MKGIGPFVVGTAVLGIVVVYAIGGAGPAVLALIVVPIILTPIVKAYLNRVPNNDEIEPPRRRDGRRIVAASALLFVGGILAAPFTSGGTRAAIIALTLGAAVWGVGFGWLLSRKRARGPRT